MGEDIVDNTGLMPPTRAHTRMQPHTQPVVYAYCDGGVYGASRSEVAAAYAYRLVLPGGVYAVRTVQGVRLKCMLDADLLPHVYEQGSGTLFPTAVVDTLTNNYAEYVAAVKALLACPEGADVVLCTDSQITLGRILEGWATNGLPPALVRKCEAAVDRLGDISGLLHDGHPTKAQLKEGKGKRGNVVSEHQVWCDRRCTELLGELRKRLTLHGTLAQNEVRQDDER